MGSTARLVLPYPEDTDPLANMAAAVQALAEAIDTGDGQWVSIGAGGGAPAFANAWVNYGSTYQVASYRKAGRRVYLRGMIKSGVINSAAFNLPAGFRPPADMIFAVDSAAAYGRLIITSAGDVKPALGSNASYTLNVGFDVF